MPVDVAMMVLLPLLMAYSLIGEAAHEYLGILMFILFLLHHIRNRAWWKNLFRGKYTAGRILGTVVNLLLVVIMVLQPLSGMMMSRHVFSFLTQNGILSYARTIHLALAYWGFVLMSLHVGFHGKLILNMAKKAMKSSGESKGRTTALRALAACISVYGVSAFVRRQFAGYMFLKTQFAFFDFTEPIVFFLADYSSILLLFAFVGYYLLKLVQTCSKRRERTQT